MCVCIETYSEVLTRCCRRRAFRVQRLLVSLLEIGFVCTKGLKIFLGSAKRHSTSIIISIESICLSLYVSFLERLTNKYSMRVRVYERPGLKCLIMA